MPPFRGSPLASPKGDVGHMTEVAFGRPIGVGRDGPVGLEWGIAGDSAGESFVHAELGVCTGRGLARPLLPIFERRLAT
jgi:hypothetical protein